jgi:HK97 family phage portal protein
MKWFGNFFDRKNSPSRRLIAVNKVGRAVSTPLNYEGFSREGYSKNVIAYKAISDIAEAVGALDILLYKKRPGGDDQEVPMHPVLDLLARPNPMMTGYEFMESFAAFMLIAGNSYVEANTNESGKVKEIWVPRPDRLTVIPGERGIPMGYEYKVNQNKHTYQWDQVTNRCQILHMKTFNPKDDWYGMSPLEAASFAIDSNNQGNLWNLAMFQNMATPSGAFVVEVSDKNPSGKLDDDQYNRLQEKLDSKMTGATNARRPMLLEGGLDWRTMGLGPVDMDFINSNNTTARDVARALGFPPILLGIPGDSTYNNYREARQALYEDTVLPLAKHLLGGLTNWLLPTFGLQGYELTYDEDRVDALAPKREAKWEKISKAEFLSINEKRQAVGYDPVPGGDEIYLSGLGIPLSQAGDLMANAPNEEDPDDEDFR